MRGLENQLYFVRRGTRPVKEAHSSQTSGSHSDSLLKVELLILNLRVSDHSLPPSSGPPKLWDKVGRNLVFSSFPYSF